MEAHDQILHGLLDMGQMLLLCGAEINRVEDTMTRLGQAYGAQKVDIFVITSDIVLTILFQDGVELTQTRRIRKSSSFDFVKLERLNALSRKICAEPVSAAEFRAELKKIDQEKPKAATLYLGSVVTALSFTLFFGGTWYDSLLAALVGAMICFLQQRVQHVFRNAAFFQVLVGFLAGSVIWALGRVAPVFHVNEISIGVIMLVIPGAALTNAVRDALFVLAVRNEINTTPHFDPVQSFSRLPCFLPSPVQQVAVEEDLLLVHTEWASAVSVTPRIGTLLTLPFSFTDGVVACPCVPTAQSFCPYAQRSSRLHPCLASDCVVLYSTEDGSDVAVLSSQLFLTGVMRVDQVQFCVAGVYGVTVVQRRGEVCAVLKFNFCGDLEEETVLEERM